MVEVSRLRSDTLIFDEHMESKFTNFDHQGVFCFHRLENLVELQNQMTMPIYYSIKPVKVLALFLLCFGSYFSLSAQCFEEFKKEGDRYNRKAVYEEAITQYLAALLCPDLKQDQRIALIQLIKGALQARVDQLEAANKAIQDALADLRKATENIFSTFIRGAEEDILNLNYEAALAKLQDAAQLKVDDEKVGLVMMEMVYFFNESHRYERAISLSDTLNHLLKIKGLAIQQDTLNDIRDYLSKANPTRYQQLEARYYPIMIDIPGGTFEMGCNADIDEGFENDETLHEVKLNSYRLAQYETTNWQYHLFCISTGQDNIERTREGWPLQGHLPVVNVNWYDAIQYSNWLNEQKGLTKAYAVDKENKDTNNISTSDHLKWTVNLATNGIGYRIPTEAEWEYAAQGGLAKKETVYSGSDNLDEVGWYYNNSNSRPHQVGSLQPNRLGLYDMSGNTWEWCWDLYGDYETELAENPQGPDLGYRRVLRGGYWLSYNNGCRVSIRGYNYPYNRSSSIGFRVAQGF